LSLPKKQDAPAADKYSGAGKPDHEFSHVTSGWRLLPCSRPDFEKSSGTALQACEAPSLSLA